MKSFFTYGLVLAAASLLAAIPAVTGQVADNPAKQTEDARTKVINHLQNVSVTIVANRGEGSGVLKTRKRGDETVTFVWTAAHVVEGLRTVRTVIDGKGGVSKTIVEFDYAKIVRVDLSEGEAVGKDEKIVEVIRYSAEEDLALLRVRKKNYMPTNGSVKFLLDKKIPPLGTHLIHVGSLLGQLGSNSYTEGVMSQHGRMLRKKVFDQTTVTAFPGSSGGGVYLDDGRLVGLILRGSGETFNLIVPVRRMQKWAKSAGIEWALDDKIPFPSDEELSKLPVEDNGVVFSYAASGKDHSGKQNLRHFGSGVNPYLGDDEDTFPTYFGVYAPKKAGLNFELNIK